MFPPASFYTTIRTCCPDRVHAHCIGGSTVAPLDVAQLCARLPAAVAGALRAAFDYISRHRLPSPDPAEVGAQIDESGGQVGAIRGQLGGAVIPRENMVIVVPSLAERSDRHAEVLRRVNVIIIRVHAPDVRGAVH